MKAVAAERRRFGYRRVHVMLERQGWQVNQKKLRRLYREEKLQVRRRGGRKRALGTRQADGGAGVEPNERWSLDFRLATPSRTGARFRVLAVVDDFSRECLALGRGHVALGPACHAGTDSGHGCGRGTAQNDCQRQWDGADQYGGAQMVPGDAAPTGTTSRRASRCRTPSSKVLQRQLPGRTVERDPVLVTGRGPREDRHMEGRLQPTQTPLILGQSHTVGVCNEIETGNQGRMRPEINRRILRKAGGKSGLRSAHALRQFRNLIHPPPCPLTPILDRRGRPKV
jgi:hypothetical protein